MCDETCTVDCGKCKGGLTYLYEFHRYRNHGSGKTVFFGPYRTRHDAETAFQRVYGFWPLYTGKKEVY